MPALDNCLRLVAGLLPSTIQTVSQPDSVSSATAPEQSPFTSGPYRAAATGQGLGVESNSSLTVVISERFYPFTDIPRKQASRGMLMLPRLEEQDAVKIPVHKITASGQMRCGGRCWSRRQGGTSDSANCLGVEDPHHGSWKLQVRALVMAEFFLDPSRLRCEALMAARAHPSIPHLRKVAATNRERTRPFAPAPPSCGLSQPIDSPWIGSFYSYKYTSIGGPPKSFPSLTSFGN